MKSLFLPVSLSAIKSLYVPLPFKSMTLDTIIAFWLFPAQLGKIPQMHLHGKKIAVPVVLMFLKITDLKRFMCQISNNAIIILYDFKFKKTQKISPPLLHSKLSLPVSKYIRGIFPSSVGKVREVMISFDNVLHSSL